MVDTEAGKVDLELPCVLGVDDLWFDAARKRIYATGAVPLMSSAKSTPTVILRSPAFCCIDRGLRDLIRQMSRENPTWGASRIHGELLMLGFEVAHPPSRNTCRRVAGLGRKGGRFFCANRRRRSPPLTCAWSRP